MRFPRWQILLGVALVILSIFLYALHFAIFRDPHHIFIFLLGDLAFVPIEVLLVTLIVHQLLSEREKRARLEKLNMVIGTFFSQVGTSLLTFFSDADPRLDEIRGNLVVTDDWLDSKFNAVSKRLATYEYSVDITKFNLENLRRFLEERRDFLLRLLENPNLLEHESFTELLRAVFHLAEELIAREDFSRLPQTDLEHLAGDINRVYSPLVHRWLDYMKHLKDNYPYLFSLAMRTNPFDKTASAEVT